MKRGEGGRNKCIGSTVMCGKLSCCKLQWLYTVLSLVVLLENVGLNILCHGSCLRLW